MVICTDPLVKAYKDEGFNLLRVPRADFSPLLLLYSDGRSGLAPLGRLPTELPGTGRVPRVSRNEPMADISRNRTSRLHISVGTEVIASLLTAAGIPGAPTVAAELTREDRVAIVLKNVTRDSIQVGDLADYVESGLSPRTGHVRSLGERGKLYVVTTVARSDSIQIETATSTAARVKAAASAGPFTPDVELPGSASGRATVTYPSKDVLTFGFRAIQLASRDGRWGVYSDVHGKIAYALPPHQRRPRLLVLDADLADVETAPDD